MITTTTPSCNWQASRGSGVVSSCHCSVTSSRLKSFCLLCRELRRPQVPVLTSQSRADLRLTCVFGAVLALLRGTKERFPIRFIRLISGEQWGSGVYWLGTRWSSLHSSLVRWSLLPASLRDSDEPSYRFRRSFRRPEKCADAGYEIKRGSASATTQPQSHPHQVINDNNNNNNNMRNV